MRNSIALFGLLCIVAPAFCQRAAAPYYEDTDKIPASPEVHPDRSVTFRLFAPKASEVVLMGSPGILEVIKEPKPLQKDDKGLWSLTVGPLPPVSTLTDTRLTPDCVCPIHRIQTWSCAGGGQQVFLSCRDLKRRFSKSNQFRTERFT